MNKLALTVVALLVCVSAYAVFSEMDSSDADSEYSGKCGDNVTYEFDSSTGVLSITGSGEMYGYVTSGTEPWNSYSKDIRSVEITGSVTSVGTGAFRNCTTLASVSLPETIESIGDSAFCYCSLLPSINFGNSVTTIGSSAFQFCSSLASVTFGNSVTTIGNDAFRNCTSLASVTFGNSVETIGDYAFQECTSLASVTIGSSVRSIGSLEFRDCTSLATITVDAANENFSSADGVLFDKDKTEMIQYPAGKTDTSYTVPGTVKTIRSYAFYNCSRLASVTLSDSLTSIGEYAFLCCTSLASVDLPDAVETIGYRAFVGCSSLKSVTISKSVATISDQAFSDCPSLTSITVDQDNANYSSADGVFFDKAKKVLIMYPASKTGASYSVPDTVETIGEHAFYGCSGLKSVTVGNNVTSIGEWVFGSCTTLASVVLGNNIKTVEALAFFGCTSLESVTLGNSVETIGPCAFFGCTSLASLTLPDTVETIKYSAFENCSSLASLNIPKNVASVEPQAFLGCTSLTGFAVDTDNANYSSEGGVLFDKNMKELIQYPAGRTDTSYTVPGTVESIGERSFYRCSNLASVTIPGSVTSLEFCAFEGCTSLRSVAIPGSVTDIESEVFLGCTSLTEITVDADNANYSSEGGVLFDKNMKELIQYPAGKTDTSYTIPDSVTSVSTNAFYACSNLVSVTVSGSVSGLGYSPFNGCTSLETITVDADNADYRSEDGVLFDRDMSVLIRYPCAKADASYTIPSSVIYFDANSFRGCTALASVTFPTSLVPVVISAFDGNFYDTDGKTQIDPNCKNLAGYTFLKVGDDWVKYAYSGRCGENVTYDFDTARGVLVIEGSGMMYDFNESSVPWYSFRDAVRSVTIADSVTSVGSHAFCGCASLVSVTFPASVTFVGSHAIDGTVYDTDGKTVIEPTAENLAGYTVRKTDGSWYKCVYSGKCGDNVKFVFDETDGMITIDGSGKMYDFTETSVPWYTYRDSIRSLRITGTVTSVGSYAFYGCTSIRGVEFLAACDTVGDFAFSGCHNIVSVGIRESVTSLGAGAFSGCTSLKRLTIPVSLDCSGTGGHPVFEGSVNIERITLTAGNGSWCVSDSSPWMITEAVLNVYISDGVSEICGDAFRNCGSLRSVDVGRSVTEIADGAFFGCDSLVHVSLPDGLEVIGKSAFEGCSSLLLLKTGNGLQSLGERAFFGCGSFVAVSLPDGLAEIGECAFENCTSLESIDLGGSLESIAEDVFRNCGSLRFVVVPDSVVSVGSNAFRDCASLESLILGRSVVSVGEEAFRHCEALTSVFLPDSVKEIRENAFDGCRSLSSVTFGRSLSSIGVGAFSDCTVLASVVIPDSVTYLGANAFGGCTGLKELSVPVSLDCVADNGHPAFSGCVNIEKFAFAAGSGDWYAYGATESDQSYYAYTPWQLCGSVLKEVTISDGVKSVGNSAFADCTKIVSVAIPASVTSIGTRAFGGCTSLVAIDVNGANAKYSSADGVLFSKDRTVLIQYPAGRTASSYAIPDSVTSIGDRAFYDCSSLRGISFPASVKSIGDNAFGIVFYDTDGITKLDPTAANLAGCAFEKIGGKWVKEVPESSSSDHVMLLVILAIFIIGTVPGIIVSRKGLI